MGREMEIELGSVQSKTSDAYKAFQKAERRIKELQFQQDEDKKNQDSMSELANKLQIRSRLTRSRLKRQKKSLHSTWPNTERHNKNLKKLKIETRWLKLNLPFANSKYIRNETYLPQ